LERVDLRRVWLRESSEFTPWLALEQNIALLGDAIGIELEVEAQEKEVGPFRADILCKNTANDSWVLIENQLERTDHVHLGQLITYAAGLSIVTIVWMAQRFTEEHRAALDWLNEVTDERINFFGLEVELWRIGDSAIAPKFNLVSKPNAWTKSVAGGASRAVEEGLTAAKRLQLQYWTVFRTFLEESRSPVKPTKPLPQHWMNFAVGRSGFRLAAIASLYDSERETFDANELRAEMLVDTPNSKEAFALLLAQKESIQREMGEPLIWHNPPEKRICKAYVRRPADLENRQDWPTQHRWLKDKLELLHRVFAPRIKALSVQSLSPSEVPKA
jgi:hypothetical protein